MPLFFLLLFQHEFLQILSNIKCSVKGIESDSSDGCAAILRFMWPSSGAGKSLRKSRGRNGKLQGKTWLYEYWKGCNGACRFSGTRNTGCSISRTCASLEGNPPYVNSGTLSLFLFFLSFLDCSWRFRVLFVCNMSLSRRSSGKCSSKGCLNEKLENFPDIQGVSAKMITLNNLNLLAKHSLGTNLARSQLMFRFL